jgi:hypothetical protein
MQCSLNVLASHFLTEVFLFFQESEKIKRELTMFETRARTHRSKIREVPLETENYALIIFFNNFTNAFTFALGKFS